jgi:anion-transporting  ArsA/GET3 family ATPase
VKYDVIKGLANTFSKILDKYKNLKPTSLKSNENLLQEFGALEDLAGAIKLMMDRKVETNPTSNFTSSVRALKNRVVQLVKTLQNPNLVTGMLIITQADLLITNLEIGI